MADSPSSHGKPLHEVECIQCKVTKTEPSTNINEVLDDTNYAVNYNILRIFNRLGSWPADLKYNN